MILSLSCLVTKKIVLASLVEVHIRKHPAVHPNHAVLHPFRGLHLMKDQEEGISFFFFSIFILPFLKKFCFFCIFFSIIFYRTPNEVPRFNARHFFSNKIAL